MEHATMHRPTIDDGQQFLNYVTSSVARDEAAAAEMLAQQHQTEMQHLLRKPLLNLLAEDLKQIELKSTTRASYKTYLKKFKEACDVGGLSWLPAAPETVAHFALQLDADKATMQIIKRALTAISYVHRHNNHADPCWSPLVRAAFNYIKRNRNAQYKRGGKARGKRTASKQEKEGNGSK